MNIGLRELSGAFHVPKDWVLLERTILLLYGCCSLLDPELNPVAIIQPYLQDFVLGNRDFTQIAMEAHPRHGDERDDAARGHAPLPDAAPTAASSRCASRGVQEGARAVYAAGAADHLHGDRALRRRRGARVVARGTRWRWRAGSE